MIYPIGYTRHFYRKSCDNCEYFKYNTNKAPQERIMLCTKVSPNVEVYYDDICDEHLPEIVKK